MSSQQAASNPLSILESRRRRYALESLQEATLPMPIDALARAIVARERDEPEAAVDDEAIGLCLDSLSHKHAPILAAAGVIEVDWEQLVVTDVDPITTSGGVAAW